MANTFDASSKMDYLDKENVRALSNPVPPSVKAERSDAPAGTQSPDARRTLVLEQLNPLDECDEVHAEHRSNPPFPIQFPRRMSVMKSRLQ